MNRLEKWNGHLYNWYDIHSLRKLPNFFVSTADSGNFVACLYAVKGWLEASGQWSVASGQWSEVRDVRLPPIFNFQFSISPSLPTLNS